MAMWVSIKNDHPKFFVWDPASSRHEWSERKTTHEGVLWLESASDCPKCNLRIRPEKCFQQGVS